MISDKLKALADARAKVAALEAAIVEERNRELAALPALYGFADVNAFAAAVRAAGGKRRGRKARAGQPADAIAPGRRRRTRARITDETRAELKKLVEQGKTGSEIAQALGISLPSVANIKKALGLTKKRA